MGYIPDFLYHYTTINTLGFILNNANMRFNSLAQMDDLNEVVVRNRNFGKYCFVSCWTAEEKESIPMWKMYSDDLNGIRIKLPLFPFKTYNSKEYIIPVKEQYQNGYYFSSPLKSCFLRPIEYKSIEQVEEIKNGHIGMKNYQMFGYEEFENGYYKNDFWNFQKEWRYQLFAVPTKGKIPFGEEEKDEAYIETLPDLPFKDKYLMLDENKLSQMEITMGPKTNEIDELLVNMLVENYNPTAKVIQSALKNRI